AARLPLSRQTRTQSTTVLIAISNSEAARRRDKPPSTALTTRSRKSREYGRAMHADPHPSQQLESQLAAQGNPLFRFLQPGYRSKEFKPFLRTADKSAGQIQDGDRFRPGGASFSATLSLHS